MTHFCTVLAAPDPNAEREEIAYICRDMNLHLDIDSGQVAVRIHCIRCNDDLGHWCYQDIEDAIFNASVREDLYCHYCLLAEGYTEEDIECMDMMDGDVCELGVQA